MSARWQLSRLLSDLKYHILRQQARRLFILSTGAQLKRLYQSNVYYRSKMCLRPLNITEDILFNTLLT